MTSTEHLIRDAYAGEPPTKRSLAYIQSKREAGMPVVGTYCGYAPLEIIHAMNMVPAILCAFANGPVTEAEKTLPANLCPLIKSSYGFIELDTCPFFSISEAIVAETTCDGKKKMFELIADRKPLHVMDLPQLPDNSEALDTWTSMIGRLRGFLEKTFNRTADEGRLEAAIVDSNLRNRLMRKIFSYAALDNPVIGWNEIYDFTFLANVCTGRDLEPLVQAALPFLEERVKSGYRRGAAGSPRVLVTGCPIGGDATKVFRIIEEAGGVVVGLDSCTGFKCFMSDCREGTGDPQRALAEKYLSIPCACMTPNTGRITSIDTLIDTYRPDVVIDVILHACHGYNVESFKVGSHVKGKRNIPFLKIETDYSSADAEQIRTRVEALFDSVRR